MCDKLIFLKDGALYAFGEMRSCVKSIMRDSEFLNYLPAAVRIFAAVEHGSACPVTVNEGRKYIEAGFDDSIKSLPERETPAHGNTALEFKDVWFRYERNSGDVLRGLSFTLWEGEILCVLGGNGSGKSTMLACAAGLHKPYSGRINVFGKRIKDYKNQMLYKNCLALMPQDVQTVFLRNSVREELEDCDISALPFDLAPYYDMHPYDLSGGQQQLLALAKVLSCKPRLLMLDEPTKGLDANTKAEFAAIIRKLKAAGVTILCVTHDVEFASQLADRAAMFFLGEITSCDETRRFFAANSFYTTSVSRMTRGRYENAVTVEDAVALLKLNGVRK